MYLYCFYEYLHAESNAKSFHHQGAATATTRNATLAALYVPTFAEYLI